MKSSRRWLQFSLRGFLILVLVVGVWLSMFLGHRVPEGCVVSESGEPPVWIRPPSDQEVLEAFARQFPKHAGRESLQITKEMTANHMDPARFVPWLGRAQWHNVRYKCMAYDPAGTLLGGVTIEYSHYHKYRKPSVDQSKGED